MDALKRGKENGKGFHCNYVAQSKFQEGKTRQGG